MKKRKKSFSFLGGLLVIALGSSLLLAASIIQGPDQELYFSREIVSDLDPTRLDRNISSFTRWPQWFFSLARVTPVSKEAQALEIQTGEVKKGSVLKLSIDPHKGKHKRFELTAQITEYIPGKKLSLSILDDSSGRLTRIFDRLEWTVELDTRGKGSLIRGTARAHTCHWRSRLFGKMAEKIVLNQVFYPNLVKLAQLKQPFSVDPSQQGSQGLGLAAP